MQQQDTAETQLPTFEELAALGCVSRDIFTSDLLPAMRDICSSTSTSGCPSPRAKSFACVPGRKPASTVCAARSSPELPACVPGRKPASTVHAARSSPELPGNPEEEPVGPSTARGRLQPRLRQRRSCLLSMLHHELASLAGVAAAEDILAQLPDDMLDCESESDADQEVTRYRARNLLGL
jgi:hypothetical protein